jgi:CheY-like chemotaxis protein
MRECLESVGYTVREARGAGIQLLVTDVVMPERSGRELTQQVQRLRPEIPVPLARKVREVLDATRA